MTEGPDKQRQRTQVRLGLKWVSVSLVSARVVQFLVIVVLARILAREMFGLVIMANAVIGILGAIREIGFGQAYIQRQDKDAGEARLAADTTFLLSCGVNLILFIIAWLMTPWLVGFFENSEGLESVLRVMFLAFLIDPFLTTPSYVLQKDLEFGKHSLAEIGGTCSNALIAISMAVLGFGVWSLVAGQLGSRAIQAMALIRLSRWRPRWAYSTRIAGELFAFGKYLWGFSAVSAVGNVFDRLVIGRVLGPVTVGVYGLAFSLCNLPATQITNLVNRILYPTLSRMQGDLAAMRRALVKALSHVAILSFPVALGLLAVSEDFVLTVYGSKWSGAVPVIEVLAFYGMSLAVSSIAGPALKAIGKPQVLLYTTIVHNAILIPLLLYMARHGVVGIAWAVVIPIFVSSTIAFVLIIIYLEFRVAEILVPLLRSSGPALVMLGLVKLFQQVVIGGSDWPRWLSLVTSIAVGFAAYVACTALLNRVAMREFTRTVREVISAKGQPA